MKLTIIRMCSVRLSRVKRWNWSAKLLPAFHVG